MFAGVNRLFTRILKNGVKYKVYPISLDSSNTLLLEISKKLESDKKKSKRWSFKLQI